MSDQIIVKIEEGSLKQQIFIFSSELDLGPTCKEATMDELMSAITMSAAKYNIKLIRFTGPHSFTAGLKNQLTEKIITCFGKADDFKIELI